MANLMLMMNPLAHSASLAKSACDSGSSMKRPAIRVTITTSNDAGSRRLARRPQNLGSARLPCSNRSFISSDVIR